MRPSPTPNRSTKLHSLKSLRPRLIRGAAASLIATAILGTSGCKSIPFSIPKPSIPKLAKPDLSKLAFWKSENLIAKKGLPKPPSLSFDSSPIRQSVASTKKSANQEIQSLRNQIASTKNQLTEPIREPYKYAAKDAANKLAKNNNLDFSSGSSSRNKLPEAANVDSKITQAQRDFQSALAGSSKAINKSIGGKFDNLKKSTNEFAVSESIKSGKANVDKSLMAVNKSLYNAQGKLASAAKDAINVTDGDQQLSMFEQRLQKATQKAESAPAKLASSGSSTKSASLAFGDVAPPKPAGSSTKTNNAFGFGTAQSIAKAAPTQTAPQTAVSTEVAELKAQLAQLRSDQQKLMQQQLAASQTPKPREFVADLTARPATKYPQMYPSNAPLRTASSTNNVLSSAPQNVLRGNFSPVANSGAQYPSNSASSASVTPSKPAASGSQYPSTPYSSYGTPANKYSASNAPTFAPSTENAQASFQENGNSNLVITASTPVEPATRHVSEVNIPDAVLQGNSNYAPGTVHALR